MLATGVNIKSQLILRDVLTREAIESLSRLNFTWCIINELDVKG